MAFSSLFKRNVDERYLLHRYKATSNAGIAAAIVMVGWYGYDRAINNVIRSDFLVILGIMIVVKFACLLWFWKRD